MQTDDDRADSKTWHLRIVEGSTGIAVVIVTDTSEVVSIPTLSALSWAGWILRAYARAYGSRTQAGHDSMVIAVLPSITTCFVS
jgi:hypothetical protein